MSAKTTTIEFEDRGQDFLEWDIDDKGIVVDCRPFQGDVWNGTWVVDFPEVKVGMRVAIITPSFPARITTLNYPIIKIEEKQ